MSGIDPNEALLNGDLAAVTAYLDAASGPPRLVIPRGTLIRLGVDDWRGVQHDGADLALEVAQVREDLTRWHEGWVWVEGWRPLDGHRVWHQVACRLPALLAALRSDTGQTHHDR